MYNHQEIKDIRKGMKMTISEFGVMLGVGSRIVSYWEKGEKEISTTAAKLLKLILEVEKSADERLSFSDEIEMATYVHQNIRDFATKEHWQKILNYGNTLNKENDLESRLKRIEKKLNIRPE